MTTPGALVWVPTPGALMTNAKEGKHVVNVPCAILLFLQAVDLCGTVGGVLQMLVHLYIKSGSHQEYIVLKLSHSFRHVYTFLMVSSLVCVGHLHIEDVGTYQHKVPTCKDRPKV